MVESKPVTDTPENRQQVARILASNSFRRRPKLQTLIKYLVQETMSGRAAQLTQKEIAAEAFGLGDSLNPQTDVNVRISAARLRSSLQEYYKHDAGPDEIRIHMPRRHYYIAAENAGRALRPQLPPAKPADEFVYAGPRKKILQNDIVGELGINLIQKACLEMGFLWYST